VLALTAVAAVAEACGLALLSVLLNQLVGGKVSLPGAGFLATIAAQVQARPRFFFLVLGLTYVGKSLLALAANYASISVALRIADEWRMRLFSGLLSISVRSIPPKQGALLQLVIDEPAVAGAGLSAAGILVQNVASVLTIYATLLWISTRITLGLTVVALVAASMLWMLSRYTHKVAARRSHAYQEGYGYLTEMLGALKQIRLFGLERAVQGRVGQLVTHMRHVQRTGSAIASAPRILIELVFLVAFILVLGVLAPTLGQAATLSALGLAAVAAMRLLPAFSAAAGTWVQVQQSLPAMRGIHSQLERLEREARAPEGEPITASGFQQAVVVEDVSFSYTDRAPALDGVNVQIEAGKMTAIVGSSGSGKSTLVELLCGIHDPDRGDILVDGKSLRALSKPDWRRLLGVVPQDGFLLAGTIRYNLCLLRPDCPEEVMRAAVAAVGAGPMIADLPQGYDTIVGERGVALSGGQRQRLALARVLIREPRLLILDEATSALDAESDEAIYRALERERGRMTIVIIAHRLASVRRADRIFLMHGGAVAESGTHDELLRRNGLYAAMNRASEADPTTRDRAPALGDGLESVQSVARLSR
jgi:ABC-type multidrug transport system fused ATPase/permease subunit